ncbi:MAG: helix-turn-helix transcriptional regulator [Paludibacteraceae bacterium]|nr:helix-turn-helix transcriptional regulator [Paludibacteraceae bacterium]
MLYQFIIALPMMVCLSWGIFFLIRLFTRSDELRVSVMLLLFYAAAAVLYADHWIYFSGIRSAAAEYSYFIVNLCVYPLYYAYLRALTRAKGDPEVALLLLPAALVAIFFPIASMRDDLPNETLHFFARICFAFQVVWVWVRGYKLLRKTQERMDNTYSDDRSRVLRPAHIMLQLFGFTSAVSMLLNIIGREFFAAGLYVGVPAIIMSVLLYGLGFTAAHTTVPAETVTEEPNTASTEEADQLMQRIDKIMWEQALYTNSHLTIQDLASAVGSNRTYISNTINRNCAQSFSQYVARYRVEHAQTILRDARYTSDHEAIADAIALSGFTSDQTFCRVFKDITGLTPLQYRQQNRQK